MSENEKEHKRIKLKLSNQDEKTGGGKQGDPVKAPADPLQKQDGDQSSKPSQLKLRRKPKQKKETGEKAETGEEATPAPETKPSEKSDSPETPRKPSLKPRPEPDESARNTPPETTAVEETPPEDPASDVNPSPEAGARSQQQTNRPGLDEDPQRAPETQPEEPEPQPEPETQPEEPEPQPEPETQPHPEPEAQPEPDPPKPKLKVRPPDENATATQAPDAPETAETAGSAAATPQTPAPAPEPDDGKREEEAHAQNPPPLQVKEQAPADEQTPGAKKEVLEESIRAVSEGKSSKSRGLWLSIAIIAMLLTLLGVSGFGLWYVLTGFGGEPAAADDKAAISESDHGDPESDRGDPVSKPINKAKEATEAVPTEALDDVISAGPSKPDATALLPEDAPSAGQPEPAPSTNSAGTAETQPKADGSEDEAAGKTTAKTSGLDNVDQELVQAVSDFLSKAHISGVRTGERPMVLINGATHTPGDLVEPETGLRFSGIRNGKLAFTDKNAVVYLKSF